MYLKYVHLSDSFNHSLPEMMYLWWLQVVWCVATLSHSWKWCFGQSWVEYPMDICCIYCECLLIFVLNSIWYEYVSGRGVLFGPQNITLKSKKGHLILRHAICRNFLLHKKLRVKALSLSIFCHFDEVILNFWWAIEETKCAGHMQLVCCFENVVIIVLQKGMVFRWK